MKHILFLLSILVCSQGWSDAEAETLIKRRVRIATDTVRNRMESDELIPDAISNRAQCILSLRAFKYGWIWGEEDRTGLVACRAGETGAWSAPAFVNIDGISFGLQFGFQLIESVVIFMRENAKDWFLRPHFGLGVDVNAAAGPVTAGLDPSTIPDKDAFLYERSVGLFAGASVSGFSITQGIVRNRQVYGDEHGNPAYILSSEGAEAPAIVGPFVRALERYFP